VKTTDLGLGVAVAIGGAGAALYTGVALLPALVTGIASGVIAHAIYRWWRS
jgi:hypothetical protein